MSTCAANFADNCYGTTFDGKRGICKNCYNYLKEIGELDSEWVKEFLKDSVLYTDKVDHRDKKHNELEIREETLSGGFDTKERHFLGTTGCYKAKKIYN